MTHSLSQCLGCVVSDQKSRQDAHSYFTQVTAGVKLGDISTLLVFSQFEINSC